MSDDSERRDPPIEEPPLTSLLKHAPVFLWTVDRDLRITAVGGAALRTHGLDPEELVGAPLGSTLDEAMRSAVREAHRTAISGTESAYDFEYKGRVYEAQVEPLVDADGAITGVTGIAFDVTELRRAEQIQSALFRISEAAATADDLDELYASLHAIVGELMYADNFYIAIYDDAEEVLRFPYFADEEDESPGEVAAEGTLTHYVIRTGEPLRGDQETFRALEEAGEFEARGAEAVDWLGVPLSAEGQTFGALVVQSYDESIRFADEHQELLTFVSRHIGHVLAQRRTAEQLRESETRYRRLVESAPVAIGVHDGQRFVFANQAAAELLDADDVDELVGTRIMDLVPPEDRDTVLQRIHEVKELGLETPRREARLITLQGRTIEAEIIGIPLVLGDHTVVQVVARDLTPLREAEADRARSLAVLRATLEATVDAILVTDLDGHVVTANRKFLDIWGVTTEFLEQPPEARWELLRERFEEADEFLAMLRDLLASPEKTHSDEFRLRDGRVFELTSQPHRLEGEVVGRVWSLRDVTEERELQEQLLRSQRMEAVGRLAGGVAHDFNNLLTAIIGYGDMLLGALDEASPEREYAQEILRAGRRAEDLTRQLLAFGRRQVMQPRLIDLNDTVTDIENMLTRLIGEDIDVRLDLEPDLAAVVADPGQIEQVVVNLAVNARDAMPHGGTLTITTDNVMLDREYVERKSGVEIETGRYVLLRVADTGIGMDSSTREQIFDPFFTTKAKGEGTGLGLATVYGIVKQSGGFIWVYSEPGRGTAFKIYLPRAEITETVESARPAAVAEARATTGGTETVLLVEDEAAVRHLARDALEEQGYSVLECDSAEAALAISERYSDHITLLLTDLVMPEMGGAELAQRLRAERPELKVLFMSGYAEDRVDGEALASDGTGFLHKPFTTFDLLSEVRALLDEG